MANEIRVRSNFKSGIIDDNPLSNSATTLTSTELAGIPAIGATEHMALVLDPTGVGNGPEIVWITAHTGSATTATIVRGREGTTGVSHASTIAWAHVATAADFTQTGTTANRPSGGGLPFRHQRYYDTDLGREIIYSGSAWEPVAPHCQQTRTAITADRTWNSATPAAIPTDACSVTITKAGTASLLLVEITIPRIVASGGACSVSAYARINSVNNEVIDFAPLNTSAGQTVTGSRRISGVAAGSVTVDLYGSVDTNAAIIGTGSTVEMTVTEIPA